ncbi:hypothetical protein EDD21DRAFT_362143 [Dissophora ornata]|nr:hypothetical protein BGZ58_000432 [Dissophora ornata]KAI8606028.1 hypothetical protein EDD21DRAFT_362143 [Dissophora ornata]
MIVIKYLLILCTAAVALAQTNYDALVSTAVFVGKDSTEPTAPALDIFSNIKNHPSALATILYKIADEARLRPYHRDMVTDSTVYRQFVDKIESFEGFRESRHVYTRFELDDVDLYSFGYRVSDKYIPNILAANKAALNFQRLIPTHLDIPAPRDWLLNQLIIRAEPGKDIQFEIAYIQMKLTREVSGATKIDSQSLRLEQILYTVDTQWLITNAERLAQDYYEIVLVDKFVELLSTNHVKRGGDGGLDNWLVEPSEPICECSTEYETRSRRRLYPISQLRMGA